MNTDYEILPYPNYVFSDTHPARLASAGLLFGLSPSPSIKARILEIGCGSGLNTLSHAASLPGSSFVAIDPSESQIKKANELLKLSSLKNVSFQNCSIENFSVDGFDYIICHGVFSWVSKNTQHQILMACRQLLTENGIAYISYNSLPGWHIQKILRELLIFNKDLKPSANPVKEARELLKFSEDLFPASFLQYIKEDLDHIKTVDDSYLFHEFLAADNHPLYFSEFTDILEQHGLKYLAESDLGSMLPREFKPELQDKLNQLAGGRQSALEQYCDFFRLRRFRKSLIVKDSAEISRSINWQKLNEMFISARKSHKNSEYSPKASVSGRFKFIAEAFPAYFKVSDLIKSHNLTAEELLEAVMLDDLELRDLPPQMVIKQSDLIKTLARHGNQIPNLRSENVKISEALRKALINDSEIKGLELEEALRLGLLAEQS